MTELGYIDRPPLCQIIDFILNVYLKSTPLPNTHTHAHIRISKVKINSIAETFHIKEEMIVLQASSLHPTPHPPLQAYHAEVTLGFSW